MRTVEQARKTLHNAMENYVGYTFETYRPVSFVKVEDSAKLKAAKLRLRRACEKYNKEN